MNDIRLEKIVDDYIGKMILNADFKSPVWNSENRIFAKKNKWNYIDACVIKALLELYKQNEDKQLLDFCIDFIDNFVDDDGKICSMELYDYNLDNINGGKNLISLYKLTGNEKYLKGFEQLMMQLRTQPRIKSGNFWHKKIYPNQVWLDGVYMALPFMVEYAALTGEKSLFDDVRMQLEFVYFNMRDNKTGLYYHGYDDSRTCGWSNNESGLSPQFWLRSNGWLCAALADICDTCTDNNLMSISSKMLVELLSSMNNFCSNGLLMQLPTRKELDRNYYETSGTLLYAYTMLKAANIGLNHSFRDYGIHSLESVINNIEYENGMPIMKNICLVAGLGGKDERKGTADYYLTEPVVVNDAKGIAPLIMAYTEYIK